MIDRLLATATWTQKLHFEGTAEFAHSVPIDYSPPLGDGEGLRPMELVLMSLASCSGQTVISLLQKMRQDVHVFSVTAAGKRQAEHPQVYTDVSLEFTVGGFNLDQAMVEKAIRLSEEKYCPVWAMLKGSVNISSAYAIR